MNAIVLAGGNSIRYGSNKALIKIEGKYLIEKVILPLRKVADKIYVVGNERTDYSFLKKVEVLQDIIPNKGPLGGLYTGLKFSDTEYNLLVATDMPNLTIDYYNFMMDQLQDYDILLGKYNGYLEPMGGIYSQRCQTFIKESIKNHRLSIKSIYNKLRLKIIEETQLQKIGDPGKLFFNINYQHDLKEFE
jgi:molybdopterin-guanine dinucleotide biosynthesis protein A